MIDGQHRLLAFAPDLRDPLFSDDTPYEMIFSVFYKLTESEKKELFMVTNEKQTKIESNLLRLMRKALNLLGANEVIFDLVCPNEYRGNFSAEGAYRGRLRQNQKRLQRAAAF